MRSIRLNPEVEGKVSELVAVKGISFSEVTRRALVEYYEREMSEPKIDGGDDSFYDSIFGAIEGPHDMAARSGETYREVMDEKYRRHTD